MKYIYEEVNSLYYYQIFDGKNLRKQGSIPTSVEDIDELLGVLTKDEEVLKSWEGQPA